DRARGRAGKRWPRLDLARPARLGQEHAVRGPGRTRRLAPAVRRTDPAAPGQSLAAAAPASDQLEEPADCRPPRLRAASRAPGRLRQPAGHAVLPGRGSWRAGGHAGRAARAIAVGPGAGRTP